MNSTERDYLDRFLGQLREARVPEKDLEADALIREAVARQPDAAYLLVQRALLVEQALNSAKAEMAELKKARRAELPAGDGGFLSGRNPWAPQPDRTTGVAPVPGAGSYRIPGGPAPAANAMLGNGGGSFLGNVATTAAGVVAGSFLFQGIESLLGHHHSGGSSWMDPSGDQLAEQTVINNYYGSEAGEAQGFDPDSEGNRGALLASDTDEDYSDDLGNDSDWI